MDITFERLPVQEWLYAVYCTGEGREHCFHMLYAPEVQEFKIVDKRNCPYVLHELEHMLSKAIEHQHH